MKANTSMIKKKAKVSSFGQMVENTMEVGKMVNKMVLELTPPQVEKLSKENGKMEKDFIGSKTTNEVCKIKLFLRMVLKNNFLIYSILN